MPVDLIVFLMLVAQFCHTSKQFLYLVYCDDSQRCRAVDAPFVRRFFALAELIRIGDLL